jgi:hypothetical protein
VIQRHPLAVTVTVAMILLASACGPGQGDPAVWAVDPANPTTASSTSFTALVMRIGCAGGRTGEVFEPTINADEDEVIITFTVAPISGDQTCPGNDAVPVVVDLGEPIGDRRLVDGACRSGQAPAGRCDPNDPTWLPDP